MASRSPACLKSRGQNTVSSLQTNRPSLGRARKVVLLGRLDLWRQVARGLSVEDCGLRGRRNISEDDGAQIYRYSMGKMKNPGMPQFWLQDPSSSRLPVARPRHGRIRLIQCQVGKVMLDQFTRSYAQTLDSQLISLYRSPTPAPPGRENNNLGRSSPQH